MTDVLQTLRSRTSEVFIPINILKESIVGGCKFASDRSDSGITSFSIHKVDFLAQRYLRRVRVLKMFWGAVFQTRLVLGRVSAADWSGVFALLLCKSVLVFLQKNLKNRFKSAPSHDLRSSVACMGACIMPCTMQLLAWSMHAAFYTSYSRTSGMADNKYNCRLVMLKTCYQICARFQIF